MRLFDAVSSAVPDYESWGTLVGLLSFSEYFVTVNNFDIWQRHVAWAKPKGEELRNYVTQRFASNMIVLSLMLGAEIGIFFNPAKATAEMRELLSANQVGHLKYWVGIAIALDAVVTIMALLTTFQAWGMVSAISESNTHALLRSSIGQYVISLPPRLVVAALYLFILWLTLFFADLLNGPAQFMFLLVVIVLFFQVIVPLSAFGRLVLHTGAMANRRVLDAEFEKELLPSGLNASLLIRATERQRKSASAVDQYRMSKAKLEDDMKRETPPTLPFRSDQSFLDAIARDSPSSSPAPVKQGVRFSAQTKFPSFQESSRRSVCSHGTANSGEQLYPPASFLNSATRQELMDLMENLDVPVSIQADEGAPTQISIPLSVSMLVPGPSEGMESYSFESYMDEESPNMGALESKESSVKERTDSIDGSVVAPTDSGGPVKDEKADELDHLPASPFNRRAQFADRRMHRKSTVDVIKKKPPLAVNRHRRLVSDLPLTALGKTRGSPMFRGISSRRVMTKEWDIDHEVRNLYNQPAPAELLPFEVPNDNPEIEENPDTIPTPWSPWGIGTRKTGPGRDRLESAPLIGPRPDIYDGSAKEKSPV